MFSRTVTLALLAAVAEARFGQEQGNGAITAIGALTDLGTSGQAATLAGGSIQFLLAAANPCGKLTQADNIITELGNSDRAVAAARGLVAAEQNFNPFVVSIPSICSDPTLPKSAELRGVVPLIDPAVGGSDTENTLSATSITTPFTADGLSVAQVMAAQGFTNFTAVALDGSKSTVDAGAAAPVVAPATNATASFSNSTAAPTASVDACGAVAAAPTTLATVTQAATASTAAPVATGAASTGGAVRDTSTCTGSGQTLICTAPDVGSGAISDPVTGTFEGFAASSLGLDFGLCVPTMKFELGLNGRSPTAGTFQAVDPLCNKGQQEALNPAIITNRIKDQLLNACGASQAAKDAVAAAAAQVVAAGTRDATTADLWNTALGFAGANTNPDNAPQTGLVGHT
ncbi:hypothetical protein GLAREA_11168 [Glarea lozoyensis ATCC 20868]|uniref:Circumsporozoite protein n=1 Tax=Glarea lozoyensis (strain ATCC 20868 / MF5171) TaxID=1116229 RepID=S3DED0_GLAL2|nr:uncharacterized protein GLAREA_11168 [Glarea lozoyensis ATCC 20868]EPE35469.1 hypothetical protein GLAREA_11168 [Glarea lozoyensis ATCC 20868]